jgi:predicted acetylornithine/succinylornithine family transaminase
MNTYQRKELIITRGKGCYVWDINGKKYLDFFPGWAVSGLGHCPPEVVAAICHQARKIIHVSNNYYTLLQAKLAQILIKVSFAGKVFFCNSGTEANEAAIKLARLYGQNKRFEIITMHNSFHGRTLASLAATGQIKYKEGFEPLPIGFVHVEFNNFNVLKEAVNNKTIAIMLELIQGEGGINVADYEYIKQIRELCDKNDILFIIDEVQTAMGRTGKFFCYQHYGIIPDMLTLAKSLGGGFPVGALIAKTKIADLFQPGKHASTFGGNPLACKAALAVIDMIYKKKLLTNACQMGEYLKQGLLKIKDKYKFIHQVRGIGLMLSLETTPEYAETIVEKSFNKFLLINCTQQKVIRIMPPITVSKKEIDKALNILNDVFMEIAK